MIPVVVMGAAGRMGKELLTLLEQSSEMKVVATVDPVGRTSAKVIDEVDPSRCAGVLDFSTPAATLRAAKWCARHRKFLLSGTTGLSRHQRLTLKTCARRTPILWAPNLSQGVFALKTALNALKTVQDFDFQIEEIHHRQKKDKPSGTALTLQSALSEVLARRLPEPISIRGGGVRGLHRVWALGEGEFLCFEHVALDRTIFARGAIMSALWLARQKKGFFDVEDVWQRVSPKR